MAKRLEIPRAHVSFEPWTHKRPCLVCEDIHQGLTVRCNGEVIIATDEWNIAYDWLMLVRKTFERLGVTARVGGFDSNEERGTHCVRIEMDGEFIEREIPWCDSYEPSPEGLALFRDALVFAGFKPVVKVLRTKGL